MCPKTLVPDENNEFYSELEHKRGPPQKSKDSSRVNLANFGYGSPELSKRLSKRLR